MGVGREHRGGGLKIYPEHLIRCSLMPVAQARSPATALRCSTAVHLRPRHQRALVRAARLRGAWSVKLAYDPSNLDMVYLLDPSAPMQFHACHLADASAAHQKLSAAGNRACRAPTLPGAQPFRSLSADPRCVHHCGASLRCAAFFWWTFLR
jgi:hypothetical protein